MIRDLFQELGKEERGKEKKAQSLALPFLPPWLVRRGEKMKRKRQEMMGSHVQKEKKEEGMRIKKGLGAEKEEKEKETHSHLMIEMELFLSFLYFGLIKKAHTGCYFIQERMACLFVECV